MINEYLNTQKALNDFAHKVIKGAKANLKSYSDLGDSITHLLEVAPNSFHLSFDMNSYGAFVDEGVKGSKSGSRAPQSPFSFGTGSYKGKVGKGGDWDKSLQRWLRFKGIKLRDEKGRFKKGGINQLSYLIRRDKYLYGIAPTLFFTKPFRAAFESLPPALVESYSLDIEQFIDYTFNKK